jgi:hypothetical protein
MATRQARHGSAPAGVGGSGFWQSILADFLIGAGLLVAGMVLAGFVLANPLERCNRAVAPSGGGTPIGSCFSFAALIPFAGGR